MAERLQGGPAWRGHGAACRSRLERVLDDQEALLDFIARQIVGRQRRRAEPDSPWHGRPARPLAVVECRQDAQRCTTRPTLKLMADQRYVAVHHFVRGCHHELLTGFAGAAFTGFTRFPCGHGSGCYAGCGVGRHCVGWRSICRAGALADPGAAPDRGGRFRVGDGWIQPVRLILPLRVVRRFTPTKISHQNSGYLQLPIVSTERMVEIMQGRTESRKLR